MKQNSLQRFIASLMFLTVTTLTWAYDFYDFVVDGIFYDKNTDGTSVTVTYKTKSYNSYSGSIVIPSSMTYGGKTYSVTSIGEYAFTGCSGLTSVTIPNSVTSIGYSAFECCTGLTSVTIPNSVTSIGSKAFNGCTGLTSVTIGNSVTSIGDYAFHGCSRLKSITIPNSVTSIGSAVFYDCSGLTSVTIPNSVTSIGTYAFQGCSGLTSVTIPNSVTSIGYDAFYNCSGLTKVTLNSNSIVSKTYTSNRNFKTIFGSQVKEYILGDNITAIVGYAFYDCSGLTSVTIGNSVTSIGDYAFSGCSGLTKAEFASIESLCKIKFSDSNSNPLYYAKHLYINGQEVTDVVIPNSITSINDYTFRNCSGLTSVTIPESVTNIGNSAFSNCSGLTKAEFASIESLCKIEFSNSDSNPLFYAKHLYIDGQEVTDVIIPNSITSINAYTFYGCSGLKSITIPNSVTSIGSYGFSGCSGLTSVTFGTGLLSISNNAFGNTKPTKVIWLTNTPPSGYKEVAGTVNYVANNQYASLSNTKVYPFLSSMFEVDGVKYVPVSPSERTCDAIDCSYSNEAENIVIGKTVSFKGIDMTVRSINQYTCYQNPYIKNIDLSTNCAVSDASFYGCSGVKTIILNNLGDIGSYAFYQSTGLKSLEIGSNVKNIGSNAFAGITGEFTAIVNNQGGIAESAFYQSTGLKSLEIGSNVKNIGSKAFAGITGEFTAIVNNQGYIAESAFYQSTGLKFLEISGNVKNIGSKAFAGCIALQTATIQSTGTIDDYAFNGCSALTAATLGKNITGIGSYAFQGCSSLQDIIIHDAVISLGSYAFSGCSSLGDVHIGSGVTSIGAYAFNDCTGLTSVTIGSGVTSIGAYAFSGCKALPAIEIPGNVTSIGNYTFSGCTSLKTVIMDGQESVLALGSNGSSPLFSSCPLDSVYIDRPVTYPTSASYGYSPFYRNTSLRSIHITDKLTEISDNEFYGCTNLKNVRIGNGVAKIGKWSFSGCSSLDYFSFGSGVKEIGQEAFSDCTAMTRLISLAPTPPVCGNQALDDINKWSCTLSVPSGHTAGYQSADQWKEFFFVDDDADTPAYLATGISLNQTSATLTSIGQTLQLSATITPNNASNKSVTWSSSNTAVATVSSTGLVTAVASGTATITATTADGSNITATCLVMVNTSNGIVIDGISYILNSTTQEATVTYTGIEGSHESSYTGNINIPSTVTYNNVGYSVTSIGEYAFNECSSLTSVNIPESVTSIGVSAFSGCNDLTNLTIKQPENTDYDITSDISTYLDRSFMYVYDKTQNKWYALNNQNEYELYGVYGTDKSTGYEGKLVVVDEHEWEYSQGNWVDLGSIKTRKVNSIGKLTEGGKNYIDLGLNFSDKMRIQIKFCPVKAGGGAILNDLGNDDNTDWRFFFYGSTLYYDFDTSRLYTSKSLNKIYEWEIGNYYIKDIATNTNILKGTAHTNFSNRDNNMLINGGSGDLNRYYYVKIFEGETLIRDLEPYYDGSAYGLWDKITGQAYMPIGENWEGEMEEHEVWPKFYIVKESPIVVGLESIDDYAFDGCSGLTSITIPSSVTSIGEGAFRNCNSLTSVTSYVSQVPETSSLAFQNVSISSATLYVPESSVYSYKTTTPWSGFGTILPIPLAGDANGNGEVEIGDVTSVLTLMATPDATGYDNKAADANGNGEIEIGDVTTILTIMAKGE